MLYGVHDVNVLHASVDRSDCLPVETNVAGQGVQKELFCLDPLREDDNPVRLVPLVPARFPVFQVTDEHLVLHEVGIPDVLGKRLQVLQLLDVARSRL